jgi:hypothetical protein
LVITTELLLANAMISVPRINLFLKRRHVLGDPVLAKSPSYVKSSATPTAVKQLAEAIQGGFPDITWGNADDLAFLCIEFGFDDPRNVIARLGSGARDLHGMPIRHRKNIQALFAELCDFHI